MVRLLVTAEGPGLDDLVEEDFGHARYLLIVDPETWEVEVHETRPRPGGHSTPHVEDVVLRARRRC